MRTPWVLSFAALFSGVLLGQSPLGTVTGVATDASGAPVPGAAVAVANESTGIKAETVTNAEGIFSVPNLRPGSYKVTATATGMRPFETVAFPLAAFRTVRQDIRFEVQAANSEVTVSDAYNAVITTESPAITNTITTKQILELPTNLRSIYNNSGDSALIFVMMPLLVPGVVQVGNGATWTTPGATINGVRLRVDGIDTTFGNFGSPDPVSQPSFESIEEFTANILTTKAEFAGQGQITSVTRGGTNDLHGSLFWYGRNSALDARNPFGGGLRPFQNIHNFGGTINGPLVKDRTFFFGNFDTTRGVRGYTFNALVPTAAQRQGNFGGTTIRNPFAPGTNFANNQIPENLITPQARVIQDIFYPQPNFGTNRYVSAANGPEHHNIYEVRVDHNFTSAHSLFARYQKKDSEYEIPGARTTLPTVGTSQNFRNVNFGTIGDIYTIRPTIVNEFRAGLVVLESESDVDNRGQDIIARAGIGGLNQPGVQGIPNFQIAGVNSIGQQLLQPVIDGHWQLSDSLSWVAGTHSLKFGVEYINWFVNRYLPVTPTRFGNFFFNGTHSGNAYADFLLGLPVNVIREAPYPTQYNRFQDWSFYGQDDWKVTQRLTLSYGLRYEWNGAPKPKDGNMFSFDIPSGAIVIPNEGSRRLFAAGFPTNVPIVTAGQVGLPESLRHTDTNNFGPRFGFSYMLDPKTVVRGGWGMYYAHFSAYGPSAVSAGPFAISTTANNQISSGLPRFTLADPFALPGTAGTLNLVGFTADLQNARTMQYSFSVERELGADIGVRISYIGSRGRQLPYRRNLNVPPASTTPLSNTRRPYPLYNGIDYIDSGANSSYDGLQTQVSKRFSRRLMFSSTWTWAKSLAEVDDNGNFEFNTQIEDPYNRARDKGNTYAVPRHNWQNNVLYELPFGNHPVFGGWQVNAIVNLASGNYLTPVWAGTDPTNTGLASFRPDVVSEVQYPKSTRNWYDRTAFQAPAPGRYGTASRNSVVGPGYFLFNMGAMKNFRTERFGNFQFGASVVNVLNWTNLAQPVMTVSDPNTAGVITGTHIFAPASSPRSLQLSLRYSF
ncbi:MAG TPA: TonB-dependent receptor [Bryobacteraceae bacterium]|nr:TonB-dependent receptor [Bryobacteraceae bacterium]